MKQNWKYWLKTLAMLAVFAVILNVWHVAFEGWMVSLGGTIRGNSYYYSLVGYTFVVWLAVGLLGVLWYTFMHNFAAKHVGLKVFEKEFAPRKAEWDRVTGELEEALKDAQAVIKKQQKSEDSLISKLEYQKNLIRDLEKALVNQQAQPPAGQHFDDWALDKFVEHMRATLQVKRDVDGKGGWEGTHEYQTYALLMGHVTSNKRGNLAHIANYAMMTWVHENYPEECGNEFLRKQAEQQNVAAE